MLTEINHSQWWHKHFSYAKMFSARKCYGTRLQKITLHFSWPAFISHSKSPRQTRAAARSPFHSTAPVLPSWQSVIYRHCLGSVSHMWFFCSHPAVPGTAAGPLPSRGALPRLCRHGVTCARAAVPHSAAGAGGEGRAQSVLCTLGDFSPVRQVQGTASAGLFGLVCREHVGHVPV